VVKKTKHARAAALVAATALGVVGVAASSTDVIKDRQHAMENVKDAMMTLAAIAKGEAPFDATVVKKNAATMEDHLRKASTLFPEGSAQGDVETWAKAEVWSDHADFVVKFKAAQAAAESLKSVTEESAFRPALGKLGNSCKSCHQTYRRPKQ
jgi:cytochrome c556